MKSLSSIEKNDIDYKWQQLMEKYPDESDRNGEMIDYLRSFYPRKLLRPTINYILNSYGVSLPINAFNYPNKL